MYEELKKWREERGLEKTVGNIELNIYEELLELMGIDNKKEIEFLKDKFKDEFGHLFGKAPIYIQIDALDDLKVFATNAIEAHGYDAEKTMNETIKEISSRKGEYNPNTQKWEKFKTEEAKKLWYKADYSLAKR